ncbi:MAG TPA: hypothetical protein VF062_06735 [Candidatus Limnocylindrales bacterium]
MISRIARIATVAVLSLSLFTACQSEGADVSCGVDQCTVTFEKGVDASASVLGVEAKLVSAEGDKVTVEIAGEQVTLTVGQAGQEVNGLNVTVESVTDTQVVLKISR